MLGATATVGDRCDWDTTLTTAFYNAAFEALSAECFDLGHRRNDRLYGDG